MKNPPWNKEELILALDLYSKLEYGQMDGKNPKVKELSEVLTFMNEPRGFQRSVNSVSLKLANYKRIDPEFTGKGMTGGGRLEEIVWKEFFYDKQLLNETAEKIKKVILNNDLQFIPQESYVSRTEGGRKVYVSLKAERNAKLRNEAIKMHGTSCQVCGFNFEVVYGEWGEGFIEVHHLITFGNNVIEERETNPSKDLMVLCANCHRMIHRKRGTTLTLEELNEKIKNKTHE